MSINPVFLGLVVLMTGVAVCLVILPVLRSVGTEGRTRAITAGVLLLLVPLIVLLSYPRLSNFDWGTLGTAQTVRAAAEDAAAGGGEPDIVEALAQRLRSDGGSLEEWRLLGRSYFNLGRFDGAEQAFREAYRQSAQGEDSQLTAEVAAEYAEAMILNDQRSLLGEAGDLLERALTTLPDNPRALWWGGLRTFEQGEYATAQGRWERLLAAPQLADQDQMREVLEQRIAMATQLAAQNAPPPAQIRESMAAAGATPPDPAAEGTAADDAAHSTRLQVRVELADSLRTELAAQDQVLFIIARTPGGGGPPLAVVRRRSSELPLDVELSDANAMIPGRGISSVSQVEVVARVSASGNPIAAPGDLWGSQEVAVSDGGAITVTIDQVTR
ncbi:MAG: hypothetical protein AAF184_07525 [Pseudomonadota bacterium]